MRRWQRFGGVSAAVAGLAAIGLAGPWGTPGQADEQRVFPPVPRSTEEARIELGRRLFFDPLASRSQARSCASCHDPEHGFSDPGSQSVDDIAFTARHSQTLLDGHLNPSAHWDGEFTSIEELVTARLGSVKGTRGRALSLGAHGPLGEIGDPAGGTVSPGSRSGGGSYGGPSTPSDPSPRGSEPRDPPARPTDPASPARPEPAVTPGEEKPEAQNAGEPSDDDHDPKSPKNLRDRQLRRGRAPLRTLPLDLTKLPDVPRAVEDSGRYDEAFRAAFGSHQVTCARLAEAIADYCRSIRSTEAPIDRYLRGEREALSAEARRGLELFRGRAGCVQCHAMDAGRPTFTDFKFHNTGIAWSGLQHGARHDDPALDHEAFQPGDSGRETFSRAKPDRRAFKTPTLRDLTRRGPYMHDGSFRTLEGVVRYYAAGGARGAKGDPMQDERLKGFHATDEDVAALVAFLESLTGVEEPGRAPRAWHLRPAEQRVRLVDARGRPLAGWRVDLHPEGDRLPVAPVRDPVRTVVSDEDGWIRFAPCERTHVRLRLPDQLQPEGGALVPDSCASAVVRVPVDGRVALVVAFPTGDDAPDRLVAEHELTMRLPGHGAPRTHFARVSLMELGERRVASYEGWRRTDLPPDVIVRIPGDKRAQPEHRLKLDDEKTLKLDLGR